MPVIASAILAVALLAANVAQAGVLNNCFPQTNAECLRFDSGPPIRSVDELLERRGELASTPHGGAALLVHALIRRNHDLVEGSRMLVLTLHPELLVPSSDKTGYSGYAPDRSTRYFLEQIDKQPQCIESHPEPGERFVFRFRQQERHVGSVESGRYLVYMCTPAADTCRAVTMGRTERGLWKVRGFSSLAVGCRLTPPAREPAPDL
jgi:hypothetical protein